MLFIKNTFYVKSNFVLIESQPHHAHLHTLKLLINYFNTFWYSFFGNACQGVLPLHPILGIRR